MTTQEIQAQLEQIGTIKADLTEVLGNVVEDMKSSRQNVEALAPRCEDIARAYEALTHAEWDATQTFALSQQFPVDGSGGRA